MVAATPLLSGSFPTLTLAALSSPVCFPVTALTAASPTFCSLASRSFNVCSFSVRSASLADSTALYSAMPMTFLVSNGMSSHWLANILSPCLPPMYSPHISSNGISISASGSAAKNCPIPLFITISPIHIPTILPSRLTKKYTL